MLFGVEEDGTKLLAMEDPDDIQAINFLAKTARRRHYKSMLPAETDIQAALDQYRGNIGSELTKVITPDDEEAD